MCLGEIEPFLARISIALGKYHAAFEWRKHGRPLVSLADELPGTYRIEALPVACEGIACMRLVDDLAKPKPFHPRRFLWTRSIDQLQLGQRVDDRAVGDVGSVGIIVLAAFERQ